MAKRRRKPVLTGLGRQRIAVWLRPEQVRDLDRLAGRRDCSRSDLVVNGVDLLLGETRGASVPCGATSHP